MRTSAEKNLSRSARIVKEISRASDRAPRAQIFAPIARSRMIALEAIVRDRKFSHRERKSTRLRRAHQNFLAIEKIFSIARPSARKSTMTSRKKSDELFHRASVKIPGAVNSPVRAWKAVGAAPIFIESSSGATLSMQTATHFSITSALTVPRFSDTLIRASLKRSPSRRNSVWALARRRDSRSSSRN